MGPGSVRILKSLKQKRARLGIPWANSVFSTWEVFLEGNKDLEAFESREVEGIVDSLEGRGQFPIPLSAPSTSNPFGMMMTSKCVSHGQITLWHQTYRSNSLKIHMSTTGLLIFTPKSVTFPPTPSQKMVNLSTQLFTLSAFFSITLLPPRLDPLLSTADSSSTNI